MSSNNFFLDIFNKLLKINNSNVFIIFDKNGDIWFAFKDLLIALGYSNYKKAIKKIKINKNFIKMYENIIKHYVAPRGSPLRKIHPYKKFINESGLYEVLSISTKPLAKVFMNEYFTKIMPQIRETGKYIMDDSNKNKLDKLNTRLDSIQKDNKSLINNQRNVIYPTGKALYIIKKISHEKTYYKIGYTRNLNRRLKHIIHLFLTRYYIIII
jgi:prophage antirepressor-like protein